MSAGAEDFASAAAESIEAYTDGACKGNPGVGGWGVLLVRGEQRKELFGGEPLTTNNRMELTAVIRALEALRRRCSIRVHTDSQYVQKGITAWVRDWKRRGWKTAERKPVKNIDLWTRLDELAAQHDVEWVWVRGHAGHAGNEHADRLANLGVEEVRRTHAPAAHVTP